MIELPLTYVEMGGKKWIHSALASLQCAYCLAMQEIKFNRDSSGLVISLYTDHESHHETCPQKEPTDAK